MVSQASITGNGYEMGPSGFGEELQRWPSGAAAVIAARNMSGEDLPVAHSWVDRSQATLANVTASNIADQAELLSGDYAARRDAANDLRGAQTDAATAASHLRRVESDIEAAQEAAQGFYAQLGRTALAAAGVQIRVSRGFGIPFGTR